MHQDYQIDAWDHTALLIASWSTKQVDPRQFNPYRTKPRQKRGGMLPAELHALAKSLDARNANT